MPSASFLKLSLKKVWCHFLQEAQWDYKQAINISEPRPHRCDGDDQFLGSSVLGIWLVSEDMYCLACELNSGPTGGRLNPSKV